MGALSVLLMLVGIILVGFALFYLLGGIIWGLICVVFAAIRGLFNGAYHLANKRQIDPEYAEYMEMQEKNKQFAKEMQTRLKKENSQQEAYDRLAYSVSKRVNDLKVKYPLADKYLFDEFIDAFTSRTIAESKQIEKQIEMSHNAKLQSTQSYNKEKKYELREVKNFNKVSEKSFEEVTVTVHQNGLDYIVVIHNDKTDSDVMYVTQSIVVANQMAINVIDKASHNYYKNTAHVEEKTNTIMTESDVNDLIAYTLNMVNKK